VREAAARLACLLLGLLAGAMLFIGDVLVPFWTSMSPEQFVGWFTENAPRIRALMVPLGAIAGLASVSAVMLGRFDPTARRAWQGAAGINAVLVVALTVLVLEPMNERFVAVPPVPADELSALLAHWRRWHLLRAGFGLAGFYCAVRALSVPKA
jgi:hypothetical protein